MERTLFAKPRTIIGNHKVSILGPTGPSRSFLTGQGLSKKVIPVLFATTVLVDSDRLTNTIVLNI